MTHPVPRKNLPAWRDSRDQLLYYPNLYLKLSQEQCASYILYMLPSNIEENIKCKLKKKIRFHKKGNQVWQKGLTRFASGAQVAENELARPFDREHFSEKTRYIVRPSKSCRRVLSFLILIQLLKSSWSWHIELWFRTIKGQGAETGSIVCPRCVKTILLLVLHNMMKEGFRKKIKICYFFHGSCLTNKL